jgi:integrase
MNQTTKRSKKPKLPPLKVTVGRVTVTVYRDLLPSGNIRYRVDNRRLTKRFDAYQSEDEALEAAKKLAGRLESGETKAAALTENQAMEHVLCSDTLRTFGLTITDATAWMAQALPKVGDIHKLSEALNFYATNHRKLTSITVAAAVEKLLERKKTKSVRHIKTLKAILEKFSKAFVGNIADVTTPQIQTYLDKRAFESQRTYHNHWGKINQLFRYSMKQDYCLNNPADRVERADLEEGEVGIYTPKEIVKLLGACTPEFLPCMVIGAFAGLRSAEIERLDWSYVHWDDKEFYLDKNVTKTGYSRSVPIQDNLLAWLTPFKEFKGKVWKGTHDGYYDAQQEIASVAGVAWVHNGLRHSYGSYRFRILNQAVEKVAAEMGNSRSMVQKHYKRLVKQKDATEWFAVTPAQPENVVSLGAVAS